MMISKVFRYITDTDFRFKANAARGLYRNMQDEEYLKRMFKARMGYELNLNNPNTFNEKLNWLKLHDRKPIYSTMVDKYEAKEFIANNPQVWQSMVNTARSRARQGKRVSMKRIVEDTRDTYGVTWQTEDFKLSNSVTACLARFLIQECPEVKGHIKLGRSKVDRFFKCSTE